MGFTKTFSDGSTPEIAIIGGGLSGICAAIQLQRMLQLTTYKIFEAESDLGGTWLLNSYPGCACDNLSHLYSLSFAPNYNWSRKYAPRAEILDYLQSTARAYNIYGKVQFSTKIKRMRWKDDRKKWSLEWSNLMTGEEGVYEADVVVHGTGLFNIPQIPQEFEGFRGEMWHSARWRHDVDLTNKRVGIVGVNASAIQIIPEVADSKVKVLHVYGRNPGYVTPQFDDSYSNTWKFLFRKIPLFYTIYTTLWYYTLDSTFLVYFSFAWYSAVHRAIIYLTAWWQRYRQIPDPVLRAKLRPTRVLGSKRTVLSNNFYSALTQEHVEYHREAIVKVSGNRITTADDETRELDVLILATGFAIQKNFPPGYWIGRGGVDVTETWMPVARTYFGTCTPRAPNFFMTWGPMSGSFHQSVTSVVEAQVMFMIKTLSTMMENDYTSMEITEKATYNFASLAQRRSALSATVQPHPPAPILPQKKRPQPTKSGVGISFWFGTLAEFRFRLSNYSPQLFNSTPHEDV
ncbi:hypothetical protein BGZ97_002939 [Linnemannia gamsii]|uniref:FAD/NAD(P)-binding domain-containing protein n=1 Tax=Linnemannia gamsii TaxID=64522 RepID=A0A9P6QVA3_9FUNG|nr:hypothetical protein BGZ97_002939 [Linnemannia gamsii]